jgi:uncharacterized membrane protein
MTATQPVIDRYLQELKRALHDLPSSRRQEIVDEIRGHIDEALAASPGEESEAQVRTILDQVGDPEFIAEEARDRFGVVETKAGALEGFAIALLLIGGIVIPVLGWFIGLVLLWISRVWTVRDKLIGTLLVPGGLATAGFFGLMAPSGGVECSAEPAQVGPGGVTITGCSETGGTEVWLIALFVFLVVAPIFTAIYLGRRAFRGRPGD